jgi:hypothetical protein
LKAAHAEMTANLIEVTHDQVDAMRALDPFDERQ